MKILIVRNFPSYMPVKNNTYNIQELGLAKALVRKGNVCDIVFWTNKKEEMIEIDVDTIGKVHIYYRRGITKLKNTVYVNCKELFQQYDVLQPCEYNQLQSWIFAKKYPNKTIIYHGPYDSEFNKRYNLMCKVFDLFFLKRYQKNGTKFIVKSKLAEAFLIKKGILKDNIAVIGVGIDIQMLSSIDNECKEELYLNMKEDTDSLKILYIGRLEQRRNLFFLLEVFQKVYEKNKKAKLYIIGNGEQRYVDNIFQYAEKLGIKKVIIWQKVMEQKYLSYLYQQADFFLLPTEYEIFGMVLLEAMFYETVVLTTFNGGSSTLIEHEKNGFIFSKKDGDQWAECIIKIARNKSWMNSIQKNASKTISDNFTWDAIVEQFLKQYKKIGI